MIVGDHPLAESAMKKSEILDFLKSNQNERGMAHWEKRQAKSGGLRSYGLGLTKLRKFAKQIGRDPKLAARLWREPVYELKILALLIDDPKTMTIEQAETQVEELNGGDLAHVFSSCDATLAKTPFVVELANAWINHRDPVRQDCGYGLLYEISKMKKKSAPDEDYFLAHVDRIESTYPAASMGVLMSMASALMGIGKRTARLNAAALDVATKIGPIDFDPGRCDPFDVTKHLRSDYLRERLGV